MKLNRQKTAGLIAIFFIMLCHIAFAQSTADRVIIVTINFNKTAQTIDNIGASGCWFSEGIGKYWPTEKKEEIARLLFSRKIDKNGSPQGIGLSAWRFNIGAGTAEQGDSSGIKDFRKRTESFLKPNGTYDWNKQAGYQYFLQKAHDYGVETLIAFSNSPPVQLTQNGLGYKTEKNYTSNLRKDAYNNYAVFLAEVIKHFDQKGIHFNYVSPVNEPQWDWSHKYGDADQEGSPWKNEEIYQITKKLDSTLTAKGINSKILITEAGMLNYLYGGTTGTSHQVQSFFSPKSALFVGNLPHVPQLIGGHSYYTESNDSTLNAVRQKLADTVQKYGIHYWETEYSMLADGYKDGVKGKRAAMDCALFLAKIIHTDLAVGNATAWQFWNAYEPGKADFDTRYYLIALKPNPDFKDGEFTMTKNLWALGHYSLFVRPGMQRIITAVTGQPGDIMLSAYRDKQNKLVLVGINYGNAAINLKLDLKNGARKYTTQTTYLTTSDKDINMKALPVGQYAQLVAIPGRSMVTILVN